MSEDHSFYVNSNLTFSLNGGDVTQEWGLGDYDYDDLGSDHGK